MDFLLRSLGNAIGYPFCVFNPGESVVICNDEFERLLGVKDIAGQTLKSILELTEFAPLVPIIREGLSGVVHKPITVTIEGYPLRYYQSVVKPILREAEVVYVVITLADVTDKMESLQYANSAREFYNHVFDEMPQSYLMVDEEFAVLRANRAAHTAFGYSAEELFGLNLAKLLSVKAGESSATPFENFKTETTKTLRLGGADEVMGVRSDGRTFPVRISLIRSDLAGIRTYSAIVLDLSEDRLREKEGIEKEKKQQGLMRNEALGKLAGKFAHDMNNVLAVIGGHAEILNLEPRAEDRESVDEILIAVKKGANLTKRILAYTGRQQLETRHMNLKTFVRDKEALWHDALGEAIQLTILPEGEAAYVLADEKMLVQVLLSILANSREAIQERGHVTMGVRLTDLDSIFFKDRNVDAQEGTYAELFVTDDGPGIAADKIAMVFEPYYSTKDPNKSSGLGLAIVFGIVKQHGGFILCESAPDKGTTMRVLFPAVESSEAQNTETEVLARIHPPDFTILVVDDEEQLLRISEAALKGAGFRVFTASDGQAAMDWLNSYDGHIDLLISDIMMPKVSGIDLAHWVLRLFPRLPVIFVTGYSSQIIDQHSVLRHFRVINKPFSPLDLVAVARHEIAKQVSP